MANKPPHNPDLHVVNPEGGDNGKESRRSRRREIAEAAAITVVVTLLISGGATFLWNFSKKRAEKLMRKRKEEEAEHELLPSYPYQAYPVQGYPYTYGPPQPGPSPVGKTIPEALSMDPRLRPVDVAAPVVVGVSSDPGFTHFARALEKRLGGIERTMDEMRASMEDDEDDDPDEDDEDEDEDEDEDDEKPAAKNTRRKKTA
jgi:hypothetical protein